MTTDFVLLHGTTQGPSGWDRLSYLLRSTGHNVFAIDLGAMQQPFYSVADYVDIVVRVLGKRVTQPVVVAHSASGLLLPAVAVELEARHQVWVSAVVPDAARGRPFLREFEDEPELFAPEWVGVDPTGDPVLATYFLFHDCPLGVLKWALTTVCRFSLYDGVYQEQPGTAVNVIPSTYLLPLADRTLSPSWMRAVAVERLGVDPIEIDAGHCPHVSQAARVAELLESV